MFISGRATVSLNRLVLLFVYLSLPLKCDSFQIIPFPSASHRRVSSWQKVSDVSRSFSWTENSMTQTTAMSVKHSSEQSPPSRTSSSSLSVMSSTPEEPSSKAEVEVPRTIREALRTFFLDFLNYPGPPICAVSILSLVVWRLTLLLSVPITPSAMALEGLVLGSSILGWWIQEYVLHRYVLHSKFDWYGKQIHQDHHERNYHHISIDPAPLMWGWLATFFLVVKCCIFPGAAHLPLALTATIGYATAGLFYEWTHYIVHTRVVFPPKSYFRKLKVHQ